MFNLKKEGKMKKVPTFCITGALKMKRIDAIVMIHNKTIENCWTMKTNFYIFSVPKINN